MQNQRPRRQRNRISFSCTNCRQGKYRCDRRTPCSTCVRRNTGETCQYEEAAVASSRKYYPTDPGLAAVKKSPPADAKRAGAHPTGKTPDLDIFGYSKVGANHTLAILNELSRVDSASASLQNDGKIMSRSPSQSDAYLRLVRGLPPRLYVYILVDIYFEQVNWQYSIIDRNYFMPQLAEFYEATRSLFLEEHGEISSDVFTFPALLFQVVGSAFQFMPPDYDRSLDDLCMGRSFDDLAKSYSDSGVEMLGLFEKENLNLISIQAGFLRVTFLKSFGYVVEAYRMVGQVIADAEEAGLHQETDSPQLGSVENTPPRLWYHEMRRRVMVNLWLWDSQVSIVLGKPSKANAGDWSITLPLDAPIPVDKTLTIPTERPQSSRPTQFTHRLLEYRILSQLPAVVKLLSGEFNQRDYRQLQQYGEKMREMITELPPPFQFENPDTQWDVECPWIKTQRQYSCGTTMLSLLVINRYSMFHFPQSRTEVIKLGIKVLEAQERHFRTLNVQHYKLYALAFFTLEAATAIMVVFIAYPSENGELFEEAMSHINDGVARMNIILNANPLARPARDLIILLQQRAEKLYKSSTSPSPSSLTQPPPLLHYNSSLSQYSNPNSIPTPDFKPETAWQGENFDFSDYTPPLGPHLDLTHASDSSATPPGFDFSCGGVIGQYGPVATMIDGNFYGVPDTWDPMILLERDGGMAGYAGEEVYGESGIY